MQLGGSWVRLLLGEVGGESDALTWMRKYTCDLDSGKSILTAEVCFARGTVLPGYSEIIAEALGKPASLLMSPEVGDAKPIDLDGDGKADVSGNEMTILPAGTSLIKIAARTKNDVTWDFVLAYSKDQQQNPLFANTIPGFTFLAGWVLDENLK